MKTSTRIIAAIAAGLIASLTGSQANAQAEIHTRGDKLSDFGTKTLKVVLGGNDFNDEALRAEVASRWSLSPYEFCTTDGFGSLKASSDYYFLLSVKSVNPKTGMADISCLTVVKGGPKSGVEGSGQPPKDLNDLLEAASFPICAADFPSGREMTYMGAIVGALQESVREAMGGSSKGLLKNVYKRRERTDTHEKAILFNDCDLSPTVTGAFRQRHFDADMLVMADMGADKAFTEGRHNTLCSYVIAPEEPREGDRCICLLFGADDGLIYYMASHKVTRRNGAGFTAKDIKRIAGTR